MPLTKSTTDKARRKNTSEMIAAGYEPKQAAAAAYSTQRTATKKRRASKPKRLIGRMTKKRKAKSS